MPAPRIQLFLRRCLVSLALGASATVAITIPLEAAEKISFIYSPFVESLEISSLEIFAEEGIINQDLAFYLKLAKADEKDKKLLREVLTKRIEVDPILLSRLLKTDEGERLLNFFGEYLNIPGGRNGFYALPSPQLIPEYETAMTLAFFEVYIANNPDYRAYLQPSYASYLSEGEKFKAYMITGASSESLTQVIEEWKKEHGLDGAGTTSKNQ